jgi:shikimate dehydrogenase
MVAGVIGFPIAHSLSPRLHTAWIAAAGLDAAYVPFSPASPAAFAALVSGLAQSGVRGVNVTLPYKSDALALADTADEAARDARAANLLLFGADGGIQARNTDGLGLRIAIQTEAPNLDLSRACVVVLGAGGAAKAAVSALKGARALRILNRTLARAQSLAAACGGEALALEQARQAFADADLIVNATSSGLTDDPEPTWPMDAARSGAVVMDMRYGPRPTAFVRAAAARGLQAFDGLSMLVGQARPSFEAFYGQEPPDSVDAMRLLRGGPP